eukprot:jgi/Chrzof1/12741/Cz07g05260.t1
MEQFEQRLWSLNPSAKLRLCSGLLIPMHKEVVTLASPVLAALLFHGFQDKDHCLVCSVPKDWGFCKAEYKSIWLLWLAFVYAPILGPLYDELLDSICPSQAKDLLQLATVLQSPAGLNERIRMKVWGSSEAMVEVSEPGSDVKWAVVRWLGSQEGTCYSWHLCSGPEGSEHRWCEKNGVYGAVLRLTREAAKQFRAGYLTIMSDALDLVPHVPCDEVAVTAKALLACELGCGHSELMELVLKACSRSPEFQRALINCCVAPCHPSYNSMELPDYVVSNVSCNDSRKSLKCMSTGIKLTPVTPTSSPELHDASKLPLAEFLATVIGDKALDSLFATTP